MSHSPGPCTCGVVFDTPCRHHPAGKKSRDRPRKQRFTKDTCPDKATYHATDEPAGYLAWHEWAPNKAKTHRQTQCPTCGLYAVWTPKEAS